MNHALATHNTFGRAKAGWLLEHSRLTAWVTIP